MYYVGIRFYRLTISYTVLGLDCLIGAALRNVDSTNTTDVSGRHLKVFAVPVHGGEGEAVPT